MTTGALLDFVGAAGLCRGLPGPSDEYILTSGAFKGQRGFFTRDVTGAVVGVDLAGRLYSRGRAEPSG